MSKEITDATVLKAYRQIYPEWKRMKRQIAEANELLESYSREIPDDVWLKLRECLANDETRVRG